MTFRSSPQEQTEGKRKTSPLLLTIIAVVVLLGLFVVFAQFYTEWLWFDQTGYLSVFTTQWLTRLWLFALGFVIMALPLWFCLFLAYRKRPVYVPTTPRQENLDKYREAVEPLRKVMTIAIPVVVGLLAGVAMAANWQNAIEFMNQTSFGQKDEQFGIDLSFYVFTLPVLRTLVDFIGMASLLALLGSLIAHYLFGGIRPADDGGRGIELTKTARVQLSVTAAVLVLTQAVRLFLLRYDNLTNDSGLVTGATYTSANVTIPALAIVAVAAAVVAVVIAANSFRNMWKLSVVAVLMLLVLGVVSVVALPAGVQQFKVMPSEQSLEEDYIKRNIEATQAAYGIDDIEVKPYTPSTEGEPGALRNDAETAASIRLLDPNLVSDTFRQLQQQRNFYSFPEQLDVDRYNIDGEMQDTVIALREVNPSSQADSSWLNQTIVYTHGFGVVAAYGNRQGSDGQPAFMEANIPPTGSLGEYEPRVYFGEQSPVYSIVGGTAEGDHREIDYPADGEDGAAQVYNTFDGDGGPKVGNLFQRLLYAIKFQDEQIVLSDAVNDSSQILYDRDPRTRVSKVAPFLEVDGDPYPAVVDGKLKWIIDGYTTSAEYPYSKPQVLEDATEDSSTELGGTNQALPAQQVNYIRNSVKVTVDAYDGAVDMYAWDEEDPILQTWEKAFPGKLKPVSEMSADLMSHVRYPEDLFKVQRSLLTQYHVNDANSFYTKQDFWTKPNDPTVTGDQQLTQPPYYLTLQMPGQEETSFSLTSSFIPAPTNGQTRNNLTGFLAANADAGTEAGKPDEDYGKLRLLQLPRNTTFPGPGQAQNNFNTEPEVQTSLNLLRQGTSEVQNGNLLTLPVAGGLLYVQPVYVRSSGETSYPVLQRVLVAFGENIGFAPTLDEALDQVFGGDSGAEAGDADSVGKAEEDGAAGGTGAGGSEGSEDAGSGSGTGNSDLDDALNRAEDAMKDSDQALKDGDFTAYGEAQDRLEKALQDAIEAEDAAEATPAESTSSASPSAAPTSGSGK